MHVIPGAGTHSDGVPARFQEDASMRFRTPLAAAAAVAMLVGLAACGDDDDNTASSGTSTTTDTSVSGSASEASSTPSASHAAGHSDSSSMITMTDNKFSPAKLTVAPGTEIMVMNEGTAVHDLKDKATDGDTFDSGDVAGGADGTFKAPDKAGDYPYKCTYHFGMEGTLTVK